MTPQEAKVMLVAGEPSGDRLGASLIRAIKRRLVDSTYIGVGGAAMAAEGLKSALPISDLSVMGLLEVVPRIPKLAGHIRNIANLARQERPDVLVTIDAPGFNFRLARRLVDTNIPRVHYVAPSVWAWNPGRAKKIAPLFDHLLALLPFEPPYFNAVGLPTTFVGHPALEQDQRGDAVGFRKRNDLLGGAEVLLVLPGSRRSEVDRLLPIFAETVQRVSASRPGLRIVIPTVEHLHGIVSKAVQPWPGAPIVVTGDTARQGAFAAATVALAASGTVSVELALAAVPAVIAYDVNKVTAAIAKRLIKTEYVSLVNILLNRAAVPEYLLEECRANFLAPAVAGLLDDPGAREVQLQAYSLALDMLKPSRLLPSEVAADVVVGMLDRKGT